MKKLNLFVIILLLTHSHLAMAKNPLPNYGMSCSNSENESISIYPVENGIEIDLISAEFKDDNIYRLSEQNESFSRFEDQIIGVTITITGAQEENVSQASVTYKNELIGYESTFTNCDVL